MNSSNPNPAAGVPYGSVAYRYLYGRHDQYGRLPSVSRYGVRPYWTAKSAPSSGQPVPGIDDGPQTVEDLIEQGYFAVPAHEPETAVLFDRRHTSWMALDDVLGQLQHRYEIYSKNMLDITWSECYAFNEMARHGRPATDEAYAVYEKRMQDLRSDQRAERTAFWRDVSRIRERLPESAQQYLSAFRKLQILGDEGGDGP
jgi:hypothetical protein